MITVKSSTKQPIDIYISQKGVPYSWDFFISITKEGEEVYNKKATAKSGYAEVIFPNLFQWNYKFSIETDEWFSKEKDLKAVKSNMWGNNGRKSINIDTDAYWDDNKDEMTPKAKEFYDQHRDTIDSLKDSHRMLDENFSTSKKQLLSQLEENSKGVSKNSEEITQWGRDLWLQISTLYEVFSGNLASQYNDIVDSLWQKEQEIKELITTWLQSSKLEYQQNIKLSLWFAEQSINKRIDEIARKIPDAEILSYGVDDAKVWKTTLRSSERIVDFFKRNKASSITKSGSYFPTSDINDAISSPYHTYSSEYIDANFWSGWTNLEVEGTPNIDQTLLNLVAGTNMTITDNWDGSVTFDATGWGGTVWPWTENEIAYFDSTSSIASLAVATYPSLAELAYVKWVTSAIQTQLNAKLASSFTKAELDTAISDGNAVYVGDAINASTNAISNITVAMFAANIADTDVTLAANSNSRFATQAAVKAYADGLFASNDAMLFKGVIDCSTNPNYPAADAWHLYKISVAGKIGGASGINVEIGDSIICSVDSTASWTQAAVGANRYVVQANLDGAVIGPTSSTDGYFPLFDGTTGKLIKNSVYSPSSFQPIDSNLTTIAGLTATTDNFIVSVSSAWASRTPAQVRTTLNVEDGADVTDATNVDAAWAVMESDTSTASMSFVVDEDNMASNSATKVPTQQSVKAYVDANIWGGGVRVNGTTSSATPTPNADTTDMYILTALEENATFWAPTGTPTNWQILLVRILDDWTPREIDWDPIYRELNVGLPATTVANVTLYTAFRYNSADTKWDTLANSWAVSWGSWVVETIAEGTGIDVNATDPANPIVGLDSTTQTSLWLADSSLQSSDIGSTVQAYDAVLDATTASFTTAQETKLGYISVTQAVDLDQMEIDIAALANGMVYKGDWDASAWSFPWAWSAQTWWFYYVTVAGTVDWVAFAIGDNIVATTDNASATTYAANWSKHDQTDAVQAVFWRIGSVVATAWDYNAEQVTNTPAWNIVATTVQAAIDELDTEKQAANTNLTKRVITYVIDWGGSVITTGVKGYVDIPYGMTITGWKLLADQSGDIVIDIEKDTYANFPTITTSITAAAKPTLSGAQKNTDTTLTWRTTALSAWDVLEFEVDSVATVTKVQLFIYCTLT